MGICYQNMQDATNKNEPDDVPTVTGIQSGENDDSLIGKNGKLTHTISRYRKPGLTHQHQTHIRKQKTLFLLKEWQEDHYGPILANKTLILTTVCNSYSMSLIERCMLDIQSISRAVMRKPKLSLRSMHPALLEMQ